MDDIQADRAEAQLRAGVYARLSETYDAAESVPTQIERGAGHARRRGWAVVAAFKDDGYSAFKEVTRDGFGELIAAIEGGAVDVVIVRDIDRVEIGYTWYGVQLVANEPVLQSAQVAWAQLVAFQRVPEDLPYTCGVRT